MSAKENVIAEAMKLPEGERVEVVEQLLASLDGPADPGAEEAWGAEIERRITAIDAGQGKFEGWEEARRGIVGEGDGASAR